jgi:predicted ribosome quality control (RQC) complex YloA/Tae2 family protein
LERAGLLEVLAQPPRDVLLLFETPGSEVAAPRRARPLALRLSADADLPRLNLSAGALARPTGPPGPFYRRLIEELVGARLHRFEQIANDRLAVLEFRSTPSGESRSLLAELTGRHANLLLLGPGERVLAWLEPPPPAKSAAKARLQLGEPWSAPPGRAGPRADEKRLAEALPEPGEPAPELAAGKRAPLSWRVQSAFDSAAQELARGRARKKLIERLERKLARARGFELGLTERLAAVRGAERVRQDGELLKANLRLVRRGMASLRVNDYFAEGAPEREIALDARRSPAENLELYFERYRKLERGRGRVEEELAGASETRVALEQLLERARGEAEPGELAREAVERGLLEPEQEPDERKRKEPEPRKPYREFVASAGSRVLVGRTASDNDELTLRVARGNDLWLHTRDAPGSHVVLRLERGAEPDPEEVLDAAHLAVHFSPLRESTRAAVHVARRKEVHKPRGAKPGLVTLSGGRVLELRVQPERVQRLLATARGGLP